ncbi:MAG: Holliday junction DNA helicase RuvA [Planctomycetota bacterium]|jgi:Holliday junction DNA helicase RuvA
MYEYLLGQIVEKGPTRVVLDVNGVGYELSVPLSTAEKLPRTGEAKVLTHLHVREDIHKLFGFATHGEREMFLLLKKVSGIGPTLAVAILSRASVMDLCHAIAEGRIDFLKSLKGVGPKTATRLVTELGDKIQGLAAGPGLGDITRVDRNSEDAIQALEILGCPPKAARSAVSKIQKDEPELEVEAIVRSSLRIIWPS